MREKNFRGKKSEHGQYVTGDNLSEMYARPGAPDIERSVKTAQQAVIEGDTYDVWIPAFRLIGDCVAAMEELLHGVKLKYGAPDLSEYRDISGSGKRKVFGESDDENRKRGKLSDKGEDADPGILEGYVIARQKSDRHLALPQFHGAAVVAQDGEDNVTLETTAPLRGKVGRGRVNGVYDMYAVSKKRKFKAQSFKSAYKGQYGKDASVSVIKARLPLLADALEPPGSKKIVDYP